MVITLKKIDMKTEYRIVTDEFNGYECQIKRWWFPFWCEMGSTNTFSSMQSALQYIDGQRKPVWQSDEIEPSLAVDDRGMKEYRQLSRSEKIIKYILLLIPNVVLWWLGYYIGTHHLIHF